MKKISLMLAMALILAVAAPVLAGPFSDVPATHWAYDALQKVSATGIVTGYPDGTFKGSKTLTRYEIAIVISRILDNVAAERALLAEKVDALEDGLTAGQAEDVIAIFKSLIAKHIAELQPQVVEVNDSLTATQAEEVAGIVDALIMEFKFELQAMGADIDALGKRIDGVEAEIADMKKITWSGSYTADLDRTHVDGNGVAYIDPFVMDRDEDDKTSDDMYYNGNDLSHGVELGMAVKTDNLSASFDVAAVSDDFIAETDGAFALADLSATVTGDDFEAVIAREQDGIAMTSYLLGDDENEYDGAKLTVGNDTFVLFREYTTENDVATNDEIVFAMAKDLGLLDSTLYVGYGMGNVAVDPAFNENFVAGINTPFDVLSIDLTTDVAVQKNADVIGKYFTVNAKKAFGPLALESNYTLNEDFTGLYADGINEAGYDVRADLALLGDKVNANVRYEDYSKDLLGYGADAAFGNLTANFDQESVKNDAGEADRLQYGAEYTADIMFLNVVTGYTYDQYNDAIDHYVDSDGDAFAKYNRVYGDLTADLFIPGLTGTANYVYSLADDKSYVDAAALTTHKYGVAYEQGIFAADYNYNVISKGMDGSVTVDPAAYTVVGFDIDTVAGVEFEKAQDAEALLNYNLGVEVAKQLTERVNASYAYNYDNREIVDTDVAVGAGVVNKHVASLDYAITADINANVEFTNMDFNAIDDANDYKVKSLTAGFGLDF